MAKPATKRPNRKRRRAASIDSSDGGVTETSGGPECEAVKPIKLEWDLNSSLCELAQPTGDSKQEAPVQIEDANDNLLVNNDKFNIKQQSDENDYSKDISGKSLLEYSKVELPAELLAKSRESIIQARHLLFAAVKVYVSEPQSRPSVRHV